MATLNEVRQAVTNSFPGADVEKIQETNHRIVGSIIWSGFGGKDDEERNRLVTEKVRDPLGLNALNVGLLFPLAPGEEL